MHAARNSWNLARKNDRSGFREVTEMNAASNDADRYAPLQDY